MPSADDTAAERPQRGPGNAQRRPDLADVDVPVANDRTRIGLIGKRLGRFLITAELGRGGMATVYRARDPQLGRDVAVKVMHGFLAGREEIEARFRREANAVAAIRHPSILALYDFVPPAGEEPGYLVSELIEGPGLRQLVEDQGGRLMPEAAALITIRVAEALGAAHAAGIVHRDVKPDNVMIDRSGGRARIVLTDFGVAHVGGLDTMTATGAVLGSPAYMSPEQARGEDVGPSSDVFSLGVLLYQLCTGHLPFNGKEPLTVITAILRGEYLRAGKLEARVGPDCERVISRCLGRDPATRFADGGAVAVALREWLTAAGVADDQEALRCYLADPDAFEREKAPDIARRALASAEQARRRRQIPRALAEVGRALAYAPNDTIAGDLLNRLGSRRRSIWIRAALAGTAAAIVAVSAMTIVNRAVKNGSAIAGGVVSAIPADLPVRVNDGQRPTETPSAEITGRSSIAAGVTEPHRTVAATTEGIAVAPPTGATGVGASDGSPRPRRVGPGGATKKNSANSSERAHATGTSVMNTAAVAPPVSLDPLAPSRGDIEKTDTDPTTTATTAAAQIPTASVVLRASHGFCEPSLDDHPPSLRASYNDLPAGPHEIFCTLPQGGGKVHVATYDLRPGKRPSVIIVPGADGRPTLGRPE